MEPKADFPLDISDFRCTAMGRSAVVVVFAQTNRRYAFTWHDGELDLVGPDISGPAAPHTPEVLDCLARAVAYKAVRDATGAPKVRAEHGPHRTTAGILRGWLTRNEGRRATEGRLR